MLRLMGVDKELGPDNEKSPHQLASPQNVDYPATADNIRNTAGLEFLGKLLSPSIPSRRCAATELMLLIEAFEIKNMNLAVLVSVLLAGVIPENFPINTWHSVVWLTLASSASYVLRDDAEWQIAYALLGSIHTTTAVVTNHHGNTVYEPHIGSHSNAMIYPLKVVLSDPKRASKKRTLEATGLGGSDLSFPDKAEITVRTDRHKQNIYGPSMTTVEPVADCHIFGKTAITALGISKAAHEFLVLHYFATDSIIYWNSFLHEVMPLLQLPDAAVRRAEVVDMLQRTHVAPSHRRMPHHTWKDSISLVMDLLFGYGKRRYFSMARVWQRTSRVAIRGFSAGSYVGLALVHVLKKIKSVKGPRVSLELLLVPLPSSMCTLINTLCTSSTMYRTDCVDITPASFSFILSSAGTPLWRITSTCTINTLGSMNTTTPIGSDFNLGVEHFPCRTS